jgi:hypothetical protein
MKTHKIYQFEVKKKIKKKSIFFTSVFETQKQTGFHETQLKKHVKTVAQKLCFKLNFLVGLAVQNTFFFCYRTPYCVCFNANARASEKQTQL